MIKAVSAFDGQITFNMWSSEKPARYSILLTDFTKAHPEVTQVGEDGKVAYISGAIFDTLYDLVMLAGHTVSIDFKLNETADPSLCAFREWWLGFVHGADYRDVFRDYQFVADKALIDAWLKAYLETRSFKPRASEGLAPGSAAAAETDPLSENRETETLPVSGQGSDSKSRKGSK